MMALTERFCCRYFSYS